MMEMELLEQSSLPACCLAALTGLIAHNGRTNDTAALCDRAIEIGVLMSQKFDALSTATAAPTIDMAAPDG